MLNWLPLGEDHITAVGKPVASFNEVAPQDFHRKVDDSSVGIADETLVGVAAYAE